MSTRLRLVGDEPSLGYPARVLAARFLALTVVAALCNSLVSDDVHAVGNATTKLRHARALSTRAPNLDGLEARQEDSETSILRVGNSAVAAMPAGDSCSKNARSDKDSVALTALAQKPGTEALPV